MKSVLAVGYCVQREYGQSTENEDAGIGRDHPLANAGCRMGPFFCQSTFLAFTPLAERRKQEGAIRIAPPSHRNTRHSGQNRTRRRNLGYPVSATLSAVMHAYGKLTLCRISFRSKRTQSEKNGPTRG